MQQGGTSTSTEDKAEEQIIPSKSRGRAGSKLKVLVRSHAMREEASPPRDPLHSSVISPYIKLIPSPNSSPRQSPSPTLSKPVVVLSPSISRGSSPCRSPLRVSTPTALDSILTCRSSPQNVSQYLGENLEDSKVQTCDYRTESSDNSYSGERQSSFQEDCCTCGLSNQNKHICESNISYKTVEETSHIQINTKKSFKTDRSRCDSSSHTCTKCSKNHERNTNNNLNNSINSNILNNTLTVNRVTRNSLRQQSSSQGSFEGSSSNSPCLSRDSSSEQYTDTTGVDLEQFIAETLNRNAKDRALMLRIEQELVNLAKDKIKSHYKFPPMSSYQRMLVHRCAAYFGMDHNIESSGKCVVVNKTKNTRIPDTSFKEYIKEDIIFVEEPRRSILKRDSNSIEDYCFKSPDRQFSLENRRSKSFEEREEEYEKARRRIFNRDMQEFSSTEEFGWSEIPWSSTDSDCSARFRLLHPEKHTGRLLKVQSVEAGNDMPRPCVAKSYSFGGYGGISVLTRGDSVLSTHSAGPRLLTKQDSGTSTVSWRLSPSSSGYKSQSQISESVTPSPTSTPNLPTDPHQDSNSANIPSVREVPVTKKDAVESHLIWAVTDIHSVPKGSIIINPQTGQPVKNEDGSIYHYDPLNPPSNLNIISNVNNPKSSTPPQNIPMHQDVPKQIPKSPHKQHSTFSPASPNKTTHFINTSTSPSLPFSPPLHHNRTGQFTPGENISNLPFQQYHQVYGGTYSNISTQDNSLPVYQQPYIIYASYGVPIPTQYENRMDTPLQEMSGGYYIADANITSQPVPCQSASSFWNQQPIAVYQNPPSNPSLPPQPKYAIPVPAQSGSFVSPSYAPAFESPPSQNIQSIPQNSQNTELVPMYCHQPVQVVFPMPSSQPNTSIVYPSHSIIYSQNPVCPNLMVPLQNMSQNVPHLQNSSMSSVYPSLPNPSIFSEKFQEQGTTASHTSQSNYNQLPRNLNQLNICGEQPNPNPPNSNQCTLFTQSAAFSHSNQQMDVRLQRGNKFNSPKNIICSSSQSSTGTNSPATTVIAGYSNSQNPNIISYRSTPPQSSPTQSATFTYGPNFVPPVVLRQMSSIHGSPPVNRSSRSPTPGSDVSHMDRHRFSLPTPLFRGMPYIFQNDSARMLPSRSQSLTSRQQSVRQQNLNQGTDNASKSHRNRKPRGSKTSGLPPNGK